MTVCHCANPACQRDGCANQKQLDFTFDPMPEYKPYREQGWQLAPAVWPFPDPLPRPNQTQVLSHLTEDDVRRIVREELDKR